VSRVVVASTFVTVWGIDMEDLLGFADITISPRVKQTESEDGAVLLDIEQGICFSLNAVGLKIWEMLKRRSPIEQIADSLEKEFHIPRNEIIADICDFVAQLELKHLIGREGIETVEKRKPWTRLRFWGVNKQRKSNGA
jgi:Coenzyme PQQ synthesis protein D (PqqD)